MIDRAVGKFKNSLGPRIDALEVARYALDRNDAAAAEAVQKLVQGLRVSIPSCEFTAIFDAVLAVEQATAEELSMKLGVLLDVLRKEMAAPMQTLFPVLLAGTDPEFMEPLATELETYGYEVLSAASSALARRLLGERRVQFVVIQGDIMVAGENSLVQALRLSPANASAHIVVVQDTDGPPPPGLKPGVDADQCLARPIDPRTVARYVHARMSGRGVLFASSLGGEWTLQEKPAFSAGHLRLCEEAASSSMPSVLGVITIGEDYDWGGTENSEMARKVIYKRIGQMLCATFRRTDRITRWDNATFAVLLPGEELAGGKCALEKAMSVLRHRSPFVYRTQEYPLHVAAGITALEPGVDIETAVQHARQNLGLSRKSGSHRIELPASAAGSGYRKRVMVMADEPCRQVIRLLVEKEGLLPVMMDPGHAVAGNNGYGLRYSMMILDEEYAGGRGFEFLNYFRNNNHFSRTPLLMLVGDENAALRGVDGGANDAIVKPYSPDIFLSHVRRLMSRGRTGAGHDPAILLVDADVPALVSAGTVLCRHGGFRILLARSGWEGIRRMHADKVDAVLFSTDITDIARDDLFRLLPQQSTPQRDIKVVLVTKTPSSISHAILQEPGIRGVLVKPYKLQNLVADVAAALDLFPKREINPENERLLQAEIGRVLKMGSHSP